MPIVLHELNNITQFLGMLHQVASQDGGAELLERSASDLGEAALKVEDLGLLMAILSTAAGSDLLMERRSERGLLVVSAITLKLIRKSGRDLHVDGLGGAALTSGGGQGWELPWAVGASFCLAASELPAGDTLRVDMDACGWRSTMGGSKRMAAHVRAVGEVLPEARGAVDGEEWKFTVPEGWLTAGAS